MAPKKAGNVVDIPPRVLRLLREILLLAGSAFALAGTAIGLCLAH